MALTMRLRLTPDYWEFDTVEEYALWVLTYHTIPQPRGQVIIIRVHELDQIWALCGDGKTAMIDLPKQIIGN